MLLTHFWLGLSTCLQYPNSKVLTGICIYIYTPLFIYIYKRDTCTDICTHRANCFVANPRRKGNSELSGCKAAYFTSMPTLVHPINPLLKATEAILLHPSNESSKADSACWFSVVFAADTRTSPCTEKCLRFDFCVCIPRTFMLPVSDLARRQACRALYEYVCAPSKPGAGLVLTQPSKLGNWKY